MYKFSLRIIMEIGESLQNVKGKSLLAFENLGIEGIS